MVSPMEAHVSTVLAMRHEDMSSFPYLYTKLEQSLTSGRRGTQRPSRGRLRKPPTLSERPPVYVCLLCGPWKGVVHKGKYRTRARVFCSRLVWVLLFSQRQRQIQWLPLSPLFVFLYTANEGPMIIQINVWFPFMSSQKRKKRIIIFCLPVPDSYICEIFIYFQDRSTYSAAGK
jgi:hypothetical protein